MDHVGTLFSNIPRPTKPDKKTERGELLETFLSRLNPDRKAQGFPPLTIGYLAYKLTGIPTKDLYSLLSKCNDAERRGYNWGAIFFTEITPKNSTNV